MQIEIKDLINFTRLGSKDDAKKADKDSRTEFQRDFDRVIFSTEFRRLSNKTQVIPFPETDMIHTRLTHSLETASVGRSLGFIVGSKIDEENNNNEQCAKDISDIVCTACLMHDIGNPPFGHSGEQAIQSFFQSSDKNDVVKKIENDLDEDEIEDFRQFNGNALGLHMMTYSNPKVNKASGGKGFTYSTLAAYVKYPRPSRIMESSGHSISDSKMGILKADAHTFSVIAGKLNMKIKQSGKNWFRFPLAFLTEAADDICYRIMDFEDGYKSGIIPYEYILEQFKAFFPNFENNPDVVNFNNIKQDPGRISYLRAKIIGKLVDLVAHIFIANFEDIKNGTFDKPLIEEIEPEFSKTLEDISKESKKKIYEKKSVSIKEIAGFEVIPYLLKRLLKAFMMPDRRDGARIKNLLPIELRSDYTETPYLTVLNVTRYIAEMSDSYAVKIYRELSGIELPNF